jgi:hypothetical protein
LAINDICWNPSQVSPSLTQYDGFVIVRSFTNGGTLKHKPQILRQRAVTSSLVLAELRKYFFEERGERTFGCKVEDKPFNTVRKESNIADGALKVGYREARLGIVGHKKCGGRIFATCRPTSNLPVGGAL